MIATVQIVNHSTVSLPFKLPDLLEALTESLGKMGPIWNVAAEVGLALAESLLPLPWRYPLILADNSDQAGALGYHEVQGVRPCGYCFLKTAQEQGKDLVELIDHELKELVVDPWCRRTTMNPDGTYYAVEICDPVQESPVVASNGLKLANFVLPAWYGMVNPAGLEGVLDFAGICQHAGHVLQAGYQSIWHPLRGWLQVFGGPRGQASYASKIRASQSRVARRHWGD